MVLYGFIFFPHSPSHTLSSLFMSNEKQPRENEKNKNENQKRWYRIAIAVQIKNKMLDSVAYTHTRVEMEASSAWDTINRQGK